MTVDTSRAFIGAEDISPDFIAIPLHTQKREYGVLLVKPRNLPDLKHNAIENLYSAAVEEQGHVEREIEQVIRNLGPAATAKHRMKVQEHFADKLAEAQATVLEVKRLFASWAVADYDTSRLGPAIQLAAPSFKTEVYQEETFQLLDDSTLDALAGCVKAAYGAKRAPLIAHIFTILFDWQNGIKTTADDLYRKVEGKPGAAAQDAQEGAGKGQAKGQEGAAPEGAGKGSPDPL